MTHKKQFIGLLILLITLISYSSALFGQDTIRPIFVILPKSDSVSCRDQNIDLTINAWFNSSAGAAATDNSGNVNIIANKTLSQFRSEFYLQFNNRCAKSRKVDVVFKAIDPSSNESAPMSVSFKINDEAIIIKSQPDLNILRSCTPGIQDTLNNWIKRLGNAVATDACGRSVVYKSFIYNTNLGEAGTGDILKGPYPVIPNNACNWSMDISFFIADSCDNPGALTGRYRIKDDVPPVIDLLFDITVSCSSLPDNSIKVIDACDKNPNISYSSTSTQGTDITKCDFYSYVVQRQWIVTDKCGNSATARQRMVVTDRDKPILLFDSPKIITCEELKDTFKLINVLSDNCAIPSLTFTDSIIGNGCAYSIFRNYVVKDFCGNVTTRTQQLLVSDTKRPIVINPVQNLLLDCSSPLELIKTRFKEWLGINGGLVAIDNCSEIRYNALLKGRYQLNDTASYRFARPNIDSILVKSKSAKSFALIDSIDFVVSDLCGNAIISTALFGIRDTTSPSFTQCIDLLSYDLVGDNCTRLVTLKVLNVSESCMNEKVKILYSVDQQTPKLITTDSITVLLTNELNTIEFLALDPAGNEGKCSTIIRLVDKQAPQIQCPKDSTVYVSNSSCDISFLPLDNLKVKDNCSSPIKLDSTYSKSFIKFPIKSDSTGIRVDTIDYQLSGIDKIRFTQNDIEIKFNINARFFANKGSISVLLSNGGILIPKQAVISKDTLCNQYSFQGTISKEVFNTLLNSSSSIGLKILGTGILPCKTKFSNNLDSTSFFEFSIKVYDYQLVTSYQLNDKSKERYQLDSLIKLGIGKHKFEVSTYDRSSNMGVCSQVVTVLDTIKPIVICKSPIALTSFKSDFQQEVALLKIDSIVFDNCKIDSTWLTLNPINCQLDQRRFYVNIRSRDSSGNISSCATLVNLFAPTLKPSYLTGLCGNDTLRLLSNIPSNLLDSTVKFRWKLRDSIVSELPNPNFIGNSTLFGNTLTLEVITKEGCTYSSNLKIDANSSIVPKIELSSAACKGQNITLTTSGFSGMATYAWYEGNYPGTLKATTQIPSYAFISNSNAVKYYVVVSDGNCSSNPSEILNVIINNNPKVKVQDSVLNFCEGQIIRLKGIVIDSSQSVIWRGPNGFNSTSLNPEVTSSAKLSNSGLYSFSSQLNGCKSDSLTTRVNVSSRPSKPLISGDSTFCTGSTITLRVIGDGDTVVWLKNGSVISNGSAKIFTIDKATISDNGSYTAISKSGSCTSEVSNPIFVSVAVQPSITIANPGEVCSGDSITLRATLLEGFSYNWTGPNGFSTTGANISIKAMAGTYNLVAMSSMQCQSLASTVIKVNPRPTIISLDTDFNPCIDPSKDIVLTSNVDVPIANVVYKWTGPNNFSSTDKSPKIANVGASIFGIYGLVVISNGCTSESKSIELKNAPVLAKLVIKGTNFVCEGDSIVLSGQKGYSNYQWTTPTGVITTLDSTLTIKSFTSVNAGGYSLKATAGQCQPPASDVFQINIISRPSTPTIIGLTSVCLGDSIILNSSISDTSLTYLWYLPKDKVVRSSSRLSIIDLPNELNGNYKMQTEKGTCRSAFSNVLNINYKPSIPSPKLGTTLISICDRGNSEVKLCLQNIPRDTSLTYYLTQLPSNKTLLSTKDSCINFLASELESTTNKIRLTSKKDECFSDTFDDALFTSVKEPKIKAEIVANTIGVCAKEQKVILSNKTSIDTVSYVWKVFNRGNTLANMPNNAIEVSNFLPGNNLITLSLNFNVCRDISSDTINLFLGSKPSAKPDTFKIKVNEKTPFNVLVNDSIGLFPSLKFSNLQSSSIEYDSLLKSYFFTPQKNFAGQVKVDYELCFGSCLAFCTNSSVLFDVQGTIDCIYPTIITPNSDGINDNFEVPCIPLSERNESSFKVFNIYGDQVYEAEPYMNDWSGTSNGENLPEGTYYYLFQLDKKSELKKSFLIIQR